jgi:hypothetical protein
VGRQHGRDDLLGKNEERGVMLACWSQGLLILGNMERG